MTTFMTVERMPWGQRLGQGLLSLLAALTFVACATPAMAQFDAGAEAEAQRRAIEEARKLLKPAGGSGESASSEDSAPPQIELDVLALLERDFEIVGVHSANDHIWEIQPRPGAVLYMVPVKPKIPENAYRLTLSTLDLRSGRLLAWRIGDAPEKAPEGSEAAMLIDKNLPNEVPFMTREITVTPKGTIKWQMDRTLFGGAVRQAARDKLYGLKLDRNALEDRRPERPKAGRPSSGNRNDLAAQLRERRLQEQEYRRASLDFAALRREIVALPDEFEASPPSRLWAVMEIRANVETLEVAGLSERPWVINHVQIRSARELAKLTNLTENVGGAAAGAGAGGGRPQLTRDALVRLQDLYALIEVDPHPYNLRLTAFALSLSGAAKHVHEGNALYVMFSELLKCDDPTARGVAVKELVRAPSLASATLLGSVAKNLDPASQLLWLQSQLEINPATASQEDVRAMLNTANRTLTDARGPSPTAVIDQVMKTGANPQIFKLVLHGIDFEQVPPDRLGFVIAHILRSAPDNELAEAWLNQRLLGSKSSQTVKLTLKIMKSAVLASATEQVGGQPRDPRAAGGPPQAARPTAPQPGRAGIFSGLGNLFSGNRPSNAPPPEPRSAGTLGQRPRAQGSSVYIPEDAGLPRNTSTQPSGDIKVDAPDDSMDVVLAAPLRLWTPQQAFLSLLAAADPVASRDAWQVLKLFIIDTNASQPATTRPGALGAQADADLYQLITSAGLDRQPTPVELADFLARQPNEDRSTAMLVQVALKADRAASLQAADMLLGSGRSIDAALLSLTEFTDRYEVGRRLYQAKQGQAPLVVGLLRHPVNQSAIVGWFGRQVSEGKLPPPVAWSPAFGRDDLALEQVSAVDGTLALGAVAALAASVGSDESVAPGLLDEFRALGENPAFDQLQLKWQQLKQGLFAQVVKSASGPHRLIVQKLVTTRAPRPDEPRGSGDRGIESSTTVATIPLQSDGQRVTLGDANITVTVPADAALPTLRITKPSELTNLGSDKVADLPLDKLKAAIDLQAQGDGTWRGEVIFPDGSGIIDLVLEPIPE